MYILVFKVDILRIDTKLQIPPIVNKSSPYKTSGEENSDVILA